MASATAPRGSPLRPVPSSASTTTSAPRRPSPTAPTRDTGTPAATADSLASSASPSYGREATTRHEASTPSARSRRAATRPSPPLAPPPQTQTTRRAAGNRTRTTCATASPAAAISCVPGTPAAIAAASVARIEAASCRSRPIRTASPARCSASAGRRAPSTRRTSTRPSCHPTCTAVTEYTNTSAAAGLRLDGARRQGHAERLLRAGRAPDRPASDGPRGARRRTRRCGRRRASRAWAWWSPAADGGRAGAATGHERERDDDEAEAEEDLHGDGTRILRAGSRPAGSPVRSIA